ncbi:DUF2357 domain-containing protein [Herpetosiphon geysericola]|uniref:DUF2357 domain-containing protein n=1 Tax=Herpetosiphon geysericola TaxID=70996 RepID=A0A0N8GR25_9CHLR|nr:DUF2357 domain-containing protein [Herpetosiphon geysericola]KPL85314.1 hypothetical protein SE18_16745 [Herpetosiphon geysericola]
MAELIPLTINGIDSQASVQLSATNWNEWAVVNLACPAQANVRHAALSIGSDNLGVPNASPFDPTWRWTWQPRGQAGTVYGSLQIEWADGSVHQQAFQFELQPHLLDVELWQALLHDLSQVARSLALRIGSPSFAQAVIVPLLPHDPSPFLEALNLINQSSQQSSQIVRQLQRHAKSTLDQQQQATDLGAAQQFKLDQLAQPSANYHVLEPYGPLPAQVQAVHARASFDLPEHQWLVGLIEQIERRLRQLRRLAAEQRQIDLSSLQTTIEQRLISLRQLRQAAPLAGLKARQQPVQSQLINRDPRYRPIRQLARSLHEQPLLTLEVGSLALPLADVPNLYEQWCALQIAQLLAQFGTVEAQQLLNEDSQRERWVLGLNPTTPLLSVRIGQQLWHLRYQARFTAQPDRDGLYSLDRYLRIPDLVLQTTTTSGQQLLVLDAKYRRAPDQRVPQSALDDVYAYRGSLGYAGQPCVLAAAVLYPQQTSEEFGPIAALGLTPKNNASLSRWLEHWLNQLQQ